MAEETGAQERSEPATPFKLEEARKQGQVAKSMELNSLVVLSLVLLATLSFGTWGMKQTMALSARLFTEVGRAHLSPRYLFGLYEWAFDAVVYILSPLVLLAMIGGIVSGLMQTGPVFSFKPLKPDFKRLNPVEGFKRLFSMRALFEAGKSILKLAVIGVIGYLTLRAFIPDLTGLLQRSPASYPQFLVEHGSVLLFFLLLGFIAIALLDLSFTRWDYLKKMRMSRRELKEEHKRREGDPQVRAKRRELQRALRKKTASTSRVKDADVLITNPTHLAVALEYRRGEMVAPRVISKGAGDIALKMRELAFRHRVPVVEDPPLARRLFRTVELDQFIPEEAYPLVAGVLRGILKARAARGEA
ncbi:MAG: flagellar biosynthesis protein FlhB [Burkholderiales bacterium]